MKKLNEKEMTNVYGGPDIDGRKYPSAPGN